MKKILFNKAAAESEIKARQQCYEKINELSEELVLENVTLTNEILSKFMTGGSQYLAEMLVQQAVDQYNKAGMQVGSVIFSSLQQNASAIASRFSQYQEPIRSSLQRASISSEQVNINNKGRAVFSEAERRQIEEGNTVYLTKENEELYEMASKAAETLNQLDSQFKERGLDFMWTLEQIMSGSSYEQDQHFNLFPRPDLFLIRNGEGQIEVGPVFFG